MVLMKLISNDNGIIRYSYQPETNGVISVYDNIGMPGILAYNKEKDEAWIEKIAEYDCKSAFYREQAFEMVRENCGNPPKERLLTWY